MLNVLRRIVQEVNSAPDLTHVLNIIINGIVDEQDAEVCAIFLRDQRHGDFVLRACHGLCETHLGHARMQIDNSLVGLVAKRGEPLNLDNAMHHPQYAPIEGAEQYNAFLGVPIVYQREVLGVIVVQQEDNRRFDEAEEAFLVTLSAQLAGTIAHAEVTGKMSSLQAESHEPTKFQGIAGASGVGIGDAVLVYPLADLDVVPERTVDDVEAEVVVFEQALEAAREDIRLLSERLSPNLPTEERELFDVYLRILDKASFGDEVIKLIRTESLWAPRALSQVIKGHVRMFERVEDPYLRERSDDIQDLGRRVLAHLQSGGHVQRDYPQQTILVGDEVSVADLAEVPEGQLVGVVSGRGSSSSHLAILARALGVPTVMAVSGVNLMQLEDFTLIVDGYHGNLYVSPSETLRQEFERLAEEERELDAHLAEMRDLPAQTKDGHGLALCVNTGLMADVGNALSVGADGVGLYRTEIPFMVRERFPTEKEQKIIYQQLLAAFSPNPVIMRMLDVGGDKPLAYLPIEEDNPFLGWRGLRITLDHPEVFLVQARAMLRASERFSNLRILLPMVTTLSEVTEAKRLLKQAYQEVYEEGIKIDMPLIGAMIEVPSAVYQSRRLAQIMDFLSVGTNDLTQYLLAVDRNNPNVANLYDALHPAVLRALYYTVQSAHKEGKMISVCGEMASDPAAVIVLLAMGFDSLSMNANALPRIKWVVRKFTMQRATELLDDVLQMEEPGEIRAHLELVLDELGLGGLIRAGR